MLHDTLVLHTTPGLSISVVSVCSLDAEPGCQACQRSVCWAWWIQSGHRSSRTIVDSPRLRLLTYTHRLSLENQKALRLTAQLIFYVCLGEMLLHFNLHFKWSSCDTGSRPRDRMVASQFSLIHQDNRYSIYWLNQVWLIENVWLSDTVWYFSLEAMCLNPKE